MSARAYIRISVGGHTSVSTRGDLHAYTRILTKRITGKYQRPTVESVIMYVCMYMWCVCVRARRHAAGRRRRGLLENRECSFVPRTERTSFGMPAFTRRTAERETALHFDRSSRDAFRTHPVVIR